MAKSTLEWPGMPEITLGWTPLRRIVVVSVWRTSCHPPSRMLSFAAPGLTYRFSPLPGFTGVPTLEQKTQSVVPNLRIRDTSAESTGRLRTDFSVLTQSTFPPQIRREMRISFPLDRDRFPDAKSRYSEEPHQGRIGLFKLCCNRNDFFGGQNSARHLSPTRLLRQLDPRA